MTTINYAPAGPVARSFHESTAFVRGIKGPIGCVSGDTLVITPKGPVRIDAIDRPMHVLSYDKTSGQFLFALASESFPKGKDALYRVLTPHGEWRAAGHHRVLCADGIYRQVQNLYQDQSDNLCFFAPKQTSFLGRSQSHGDVLRLTQTNADLIGHCESLSHLYDLPLQLLPEHDQVSAPSKIDAPRYGLVSSELEHNPLCLPSSHQPKTDYPPQSAGQQDEQPHARRGHDERTEHYNPIASLSSSILNGTASKYHLSAPYSISLVDGAIIRIERCEEEEVYWDLQVPDTNNYVTIDGAIHHNSGKSVTCCMDIMMHALKQPAGRDGWARSRVVIVRNTFPELKSTTIKTWLDWFPEDVFGKVKWDSPITHTLQLGDKRILEAVFLAVDRPEDTKKLLSLETTWLWLNEARELPKAVLDAGSGRVGRYPSASTGAGAYHPCVLMDTNPPADDHWWYRLAEEERPDSFDFFDQPSGLSEEAENLDWLNQTAETIILPVGHPQRRAQGRIYYERLVAGKDPNWVKVYVKAEYGSVADGRAIFPEFNERIHVAAEPLIAHNGLPIYLGFDFGLTPACVISQLTPRGQFRVLDEVVGSDIGLSQFIDTQLKPHLSMKYPNAKIISLHDPAGTQRSQADEVTCRQILKNKGLNPSSVSTNAFMPRREAVAYFLTRLIDGEPAFILSPTCKVLRKALNGDYKFKRVNVPGEERYKDVPDKNACSHIAEALQYACIHFHNPGRAEPKRRMPRAATYKPALTAGY